VARVVHRLGGSVQALWLGGGSLPPDAPPNFYADIAQMAQAQQKKLVLDASGPGLEVPVRSKIGAGDTFVGAFVSTLDQMHPDTSPSTLCQALRHAMAASAAALASWGQPCVRPAKWRTCWRRYRSFLWKIKFFSLIGSQR